MERRPYTLADLLRVMERLRDPAAGCPWDLEQDFRSIVPSTLEECYELAEAIETDDFEHLPEELGDLLFQVIFYAQLGRERDLFSFDEIVHTLVKKLLRRHPHVFADGEIEGRVDGSSSVEEVRRSWEAIKQTERESRAASGALDGVAVTLPALPRAQKLQKRAARVDFDWNDAAEVLDKLEEEIAELRRAISVGGAAHIDEEMGDVLFSCVNLARHLQLDAESSLRGASRKFERRFRRMEQSAADSGCVLADLDAAQLDQLWRDAKQSG